MYATIRRYRVIPGQLGAFNQKVNEGFLPIISASPGFVSYQGIDAGDGDWASVSIFETKEGALASNQAAAAFVAEHLAPLIVGKVETLSGRVAASKRR
jgi:hypothetical protein